MKNKSKKIRFDMLGASISSVFIFLFPILMGCDSQGIKRNNQTYSKKSDRAVHELEKAGEYKAAETIRDMQQKGLSEQQIEWVIKTATKK